MHGCLTSFFSDTNSFLLVRVLIEFGHVPCISNPSGNTYNCFRLVWQLERNLVAAACSVQIVHIDKSENLLAAKLMLLIENYEGQCHYFLNERSPILQMISM
uniref:Uncharacterized protein n=1 Tax=Populus davidiana TaxID=266767 RepID=A0A6M2EDD7_9ROSI